LPSKAVTDRVEEMFMRFRGWIAAVGAAGLVAGVLAMASPALGPQSYDRRDDQTPPTLRVVKTIGEAGSADPEAVFPDGTTFKVTVECESIKGDENLSDSLPLSVLTFSEDGQPESALSSLPWGTDGKAFVLTDPSLSYKQCSAAETDIESSDPTVTDSSVSTEYKCEASASKAERDHKFDYKTAEADSYDHQGPEFGCLKPTDNGYDDTDSAEVQFTSSRDYRACNADKERSHGYVDEQSKRERRSDCQETGTLTVDNTWTPPVETPVAVAVSPTFTG
jgi:hypothetical protein